MSCDSVSVAACRSAQSRVMGLKEQQAILSDLRSSGHLGKKKFKAVNDALVREITVEQGRVVSRCGIGIR